ncbi:hypothetical protein FRZ00_07055 [Streptomyces mobaraensis]|uniref:Uncharacterized protein n=2 Tax=Streptomyces mobaraensis TaxID=35621 RepID=A0A5N5WBY0_STRMB|nr:hypothetical protein FRZ00_07055 [Streptomyces mobaraensis]
MRHPLTTQNQEELEILAKARSMLERNLPSLKRKVKDGEKEICPVGFSLNDVRYNETQSQGTSTTTASGSATGTGELSAQLMLGITASVSGSLTTAWKHTSSVTVPVGSRVDVVATTRRQVRRFSYDIPVTFGGLVALYYEQPVRVRCAPPQTQNEYCQVIAWPLGEVADGKDNFDMSDPGRRFLQKGLAEIVAVKVGEHRVFQPEEIDMKEQKQPL